MLRTAARVAVVALLLAGLAPGCGRPPARGAKASGEPCGGDEECLHGLCVGGVVGPSPHCTVSCATQEDCPHGWSCAGVTQAGVLVCSRSAPTPFGGGH